MTNAETLFRQYRGKRLLLDTNLLLLFLIGTFDRNLIPRFKRTTAFSINDFETLATLLSFFDSWITTPQLLTEVSSLANSLPDSMKPQWHLHLRVQTDSLLELFVPSIELMQQQSFLAFGLADSSICAAAPTALVLTEDFRLSGYLRNKALPVMNFRDVLALALGAGSGRR